MKLRSLSLIAALCALEVSAFEVKQVFREERFSRGNVNLRPVQEIDAASWIWPKGVPFSEDSRPVVRFRTAFEARKEPLRIDVSADARFVLRAAVDLEKCEDGTELFMICDADKNKTITASDARLILRASVNLETLN